MRNQYYEKPVSTWNGKNIWNWMTGTGMNHEQRVRVHGPQSTQTSKSNTVSSQKGRPRAPAKSSHSSVNISAEHKSSTSNSSNGSSQKLRREPSIKSKSSSLFGSTEEIRPSVSKLSQKSLSFSYQSNQSKEKEVFNSSASKSTNLDPTPNEKKSPNKTFVPVTTSKTNKNRRNVKVVKSSSSFQRTRLSHSVQSESNRRCCTGERICVVLIIIGCCVSGFIGYRIYLERGKNSVALNNTKEKLVEDVEGFSKSETMKNVYTIWAKYKDSYGSLGLDKEKDYYKPRNETKFPFSINLKVTSNGDEYVVVNENGTGIEQCRFLVKSLVWEELSDFKRAILIPESCGEIKEIRFCKEKDQ